MISCLLIHVSRNPHGMPVRQEAGIAGETLEIGRGAACQIHLPDHRVSLLHARIVISQDGTLSIEQVGDVTLKINGHIAQRSPLLFGTRIEIGPYLLLVESAPEGHDLAVSVEEVQSLQVQSALLSAQAVPVTLADLAFSKRKLGVMLALCILFVFLVLPMFPSLSAALDEWQAEWPVTLNGSWSPGPLAGGHALFEGKCSTCHQQPFQAVSEQICTDCHQQVGTHVSNKSLQDSAFKSVTCTDCHSDHQGRASLQHDAEKCVACHGDIKRLSVNSKTGNVSEFANDHPAFHLTLPDVKEGVRVPQADHPVERSGLKYSHKVHLDKEGVSTPQGDTLMQCQDCHKLDASGEHFAAMTMEKSCQSSGCHALDFTEPVEGVVPHGSERAVMSRLRELYAAWLADAPENMAGCDAAKSAGNLVQHTLACVNEFARKNAAASLFRKDVECGECHEITPTGEADVPWKVTPLRINRDWQPGARFAHNKHGAMDCTECHDKSNSNRSADIAMPTITKCRECHAGKQSARGQVVTDCAGCHRFHRDEKK